MSATVIRMATRERRQLAGPEAAGRPALSMTERKLLADFRLLPERAQGTIAMLTAGIAAKHLPADWTEDGTQ